MQTRLFALALGLLYLILGIAGFIPVMRTTPPATAPHVDVTTSYGYLFGVLPVNLLSNLLSILVGFAGTIAGARLVLARYYCQLLFLGFGLLTFIGFLPTVDTVWGLMPVFNGDTWLHAATAVAAAYFGFVATESANVEPAVVSAH